MTLIERMKPEPLARLRELAIIYPYSVGAVIKELEITNFWHYLSYASVMELGSSLTDGNYSPTAISNLFND
jgi:hypothetical protein